MKLDVSFVRRVLPDAQIQGVEPEIFTFALDSRQVKPGDIFVALQGLRTDGHLHIQDAVARGATGYFINKPFLSSVLSQVQNNAFIVAVDDTHDAFVELARAWRSQCTITFVAITGTMGKTTTKELLASIVGQSGFSYIASFGNQNTLLGASLNLLRITDQTQVAIFEVGISKRTEMKDIVQLLQPTYAAITCIGHQHMDGLGSSLHDIAQEKRVIFSCFNEDNIGVINGDQALLEDIAYAHPVIKFGLKTNNQIQARKINISGEKTSLILKIYDEKFPVVIPSNHRGYIMNVLAASALAYLLKIPAAIIAKAVEKPVVVASRQEKLKIQNNRGILINDCYNANPENVKEALLSLEHTATGKKSIFVFGDMLGLGSEAPFWHRQIGRFLAKIPTLVRVILVGDLVQWTKNAAPRGLTIDHVSNWQQAASILESQLNDDTVVLVKGSLAMNLGSLVKHFVQEAA